ncbi:MAG: hypothetical protein FOGNACKC_01410 [Anaerolineae bacterium]|nr:hypothetical protein [Anaerolineae bacterium]
MSPTTHITTSGGLISTAFIENIRQPQTNQRGAQPDTYGLLRQAVPKSPAALEAAIAASWETLLERWDAIAAELPALDISPARDRWILPLLRALDFQPAYQRSDIVLDDSEALRFNISHFGWAISNDERGTMNKEQKTQPSSFSLHPFFAPPPIHTVAPATDLDARPAGASNSRSAKGKSPHDMLQLFLNVSRAHRWGVLTNGLHLRLLRDYHHTYTKGFVEFDLDSIFETRNFADFRALYRLAHASRFSGAAAPPADEAAEPVESWDSVPLEIFYRDSQAAGVQVGADLQKQVREAIETLGNGFLHSGGPLLAQLQTDTTLCQQFYAELLHLVYRILFLLYAEQRGMVPQSGAPLADLYRQSYSLTALHAKAENDPASPEAYDLWEGLKVTFKMFQKGAPELGVYRYNGMLFAEDQTPLLDGLPSPSQGEGLGMGVSLRCRNFELLRAIRALTLIEREGVLQRISYADLNVEEIGGIYESLLDFAPRVTTAAETVEGRELPPHTFFLDPRGTARKTSGSYYTHPSLVNALIESALLPVLAERLKEAGSKETGVRGTEEPPAAYSLLLTPEQRQAAEQAILQLKVCDPAMGSGHFLIAANNALALRLAQIRTGDDYPAERHLRRARRDVLAHCIYGVDLNPMAVELAKVSLWINAAVDDAPLSFLDHHLKCGNSLIGATPDLLQNGIPDDAFAPVTGDDNKVAGAVKAQNRKERKEREAGARQQSFWAVTAVYQPNTESWGELTELAQTDPQQARQTYRQMLDDELFRMEKFAADLWAASFFWPLTGGGAADGLWPTDATFQLFEQEGERIAAPAFRARVRQLAERHRFFHWHLEFPDVFQAAPEGIRSQELGIGQNTTLIPDSQSLTPTSGFDVVLGNPPWERIQPEVLKFFAAVRPDFLELNRSDRDKAITELKKSDPQLYRAWIEKRREELSKTRFLKASDRFPLSTSKNINSYAAFQELALNLVSTEGYSGLVLQSGIATDDINKELFNYLISSERLISLFDFENRQGIFPDVHRMMKFCLLTCGGNPQPLKPSFLFYGQTIDDLRLNEKTFSMSKHEFELLAPNTGLCPTFRTKTDAELVVKLYSRIGAFVTDGDKEGNPWHVDIRRIFSGYYDSQILGVPSEFYENGNKVFFADWMPVYEAKLFHQFDHRFATYLDVAEKSLSKRPEESLGAKTEPDFVSFTRNWVNKMEFIGRLSRNDWHSPYLIAYRDVTNSMNERTCIASFLPYTATDDTIRVVFARNANSHRHCGLVANLNSFALDYAARNTVASTHLSEYLAKQLPVIPPERYTPELLAFIVPRVLELTYTAWDLRPFADDVWAEAGSRSSELGVREKAPTSYSLLPTPGEAFTPLQQAILQQWAANRDATGGGHEGAVPPEWALRKAEGERLNDEPIHNSPFTIHHSQFPHPPFKWDDARRAQLRADLDGLYGQLYGLTREELAYILDTFPIVRRKDEAQYGEYRTKRLVLEAYERVGEMGIVDLERTV